MADLPSVEAYLEGWTSISSVRSALRSDRRLSTTKRVITHRIRVTGADQLDDSLEALAAEAYEDVGPGFRGR